MMELTLDGHELRRLAEAMEAELKQLADELRDRKADPAVEFERDCIALRTQVISASVRAMAPGNKIQNVGVELWKNTGS